MHRCETLTAAGEAAVSPRVEPDAVEPAAPLQPGDFAAGLRTRPHDAAAYATFATGTSESFTPAACAVGDFASGTRLPANPRAIGDYATGTRARDARQSRAYVGDRGRSARERQEARWASA